VDVPRPSADAIQRTPEPPAPATKHPDAVQAEAPGPATAGGPLKKPTRQRRWLRWVGLFILLYLVGAVLGLLPCAFSHATLGSRSVSVLSYYPGIMGKRTPGQFQVETGGHSITVRGNVVDLGSGNTVTIPPWCREIWVVVRWGRASVTFTAP
jgi:hypothetical protein